MTARVIASMLLFVLCLVCSTAYALYSVSDKGDWPKTWPKELETLRASSRTFVGPKAAFHHHAIPFTKQEDTLSAWPHLLKTKTEAAPVILVRGPSFFLGEKVKAGVIVHCPPPGQSDNPATPEAPINSPSVRERWMYTTYIEVVVDGEIVDLNRLQLPAYTPIVDERFKKTAAK